MNSPYQNKKYIIDTNQAPRAIGPYSQAVGYGGLLFVSGQIPIDPGTGEVLQGGVEAQTRRVLDNLQAVLMAAGLDFSHVLKTTIYLRNMNDYQIVNDVYALYFDHSPPARVAVEVSRLPRDVLVEIDAVAAAPTDYAARVGQVEEAQSSTHLGPDEWEAQHKEDAERVHSDTLVGELPEIEPPPGSVAVGDDRPAPSEASDPAEKLEAADAEPDEAAPPAPDRSAERGAFKTQELDVNDLQESSSPPPMTGLKIPRPPKNDKDS